MSVREKLNIRGGISMISALIVDDSEEARNELRNALYSDNDIEVVAEAEDGLEAEEKILTFMPQVVLVDLVMPRLDGIGLIRRIIGRHDVHMPVFIMVSEAASDQTIKMAFNSGASYYYLKPFQTEDLIYTIKRTCCNNNMRLDGSSACADDNNVCVNDKSACADDNNVCMNDKSACTGDDNSCLSAKRFSRYNSLLNEYNLRNMKRTDGKKDDYELEITEILHMYGIRSGIKGYYYLRRAIEMVNKKDNSPKLLSKEIYYNIACEFNTSYASVERNIRYAIETGFRNKNASLPEQLCFLKSGERRLKSFEFIRCIVDYMKVRNI